MNANVRLQEEEYMHLSYDKIQTRNSRTYIMQRQSSADLSYGKGQSVMLGVT